MNGKRFTLTNRSLREIGNDTAIADDGVPCTQRFVCNLLNEFQKENEQLKSEIEKLSYSNEDLLSEKRNWQRMSDEYCKLSEDNEQLKSTLYYLLNVIQNKCPKYYPKCKEIVRSCFENDSTNSRNDFNNNENDGDVE